MTLKKLKSKRLRRNKWLSRLLKLFSLSIFVGLLMTQYQNCGAPTGGLNLGSNGTSTSSLTASPTTFPAIGQSIVLILSGGPYNTITWGIPAGVTSGTCVNNSVTCSLVFTTAGSYSVTATTYDQNGKYSSPSVSFVVTSSGGSPDPGPGPSPTPTPSPGTVCSATTNGVLDINSTYVDNNCVLHASGWGWDATALQSTLVKVKEGSGYLFCQATVSTARSDLPAGTACVPPNGTGNPGFTCTADNFRLSGTNTTTIKAQIYNGGTKTKDLNSFNISVPTQCVDIYNQH